MRPPLGTILSGASLMTGVHVALIRGSDRRKATVKARDWFVYWAHETGYSFTEIAEYMGRASHAFAVEANRRMTRRASAAEQMAVQVERTA